MPSAKTATLEADVRYIEFSHAGWKYRALVDNGEVLKCEALVDGQWRRTGSANVHHAASQAVTAELEELRNGHK